MNCAEARAWLQLRQPLPLEAGADLASDLAEHVHGCAVCTGTVRQAAGFDAALGHAMRAVATPPTLQPRLLVLVENARRALQREWLLRILAPLAAVFVISWISWHFWLSSPNQYPVQIYDLDTWARATPGPQTPITLTYLTGTLPKEIRVRWNWSYYQRAYLAEYQGRRLAVLEFQRGSSEAAIVLLTPDAVAPELLEQFDGGRFAYLFKNAVPSEYVAFVVIRSGQYADFLKIDASEE